MLIKTNDVTTIPTTALIVPPVTGCEILLLMGSNGNKTFNRIAGKPNPTVVGSPVDSTGYTTFKASANYLQTATKEAASQTLIAVGRFLDDGSFSSKAGSLYGTYNNPLVGSNPANYSGGVFVAQGNGTVQAGAQRQVPAGGIESGLQTITQATNGNWALYTHEIPVNAGTKFTNQTTGGVVQGSSTNTHLITDAFLRVGSDYFARGGQTDIAFFAMFSRTLTTQEMTDVLAWARAIVLAQAGITV